MSVSLSVSVSTRLPQKLHVRILSYFPHTLLVELWPWLNPPLAAAFYRPDALCIFDFVDDVMFSDN